MADNEATKRPTIQDRYEEVARQRRRDEAIARRKASVPVGEVAQDVVQSTPGVV
jgi:hypothetical protein